MSDLWKPHHPLKQRENLRAHAYLDSVSVLTLDQRHARLFVFKNDHLKEKENFFDPLLKPQEKQGYFKSNYLYGRGGGNSEKHNQERSSIKQYSHYIVHKIKALLNEKRFRLMIILASEKMHSIFKAEAWELLKDHHIIIYKGEFVKESIDKIEQRTHQIIETLAPPTS